MDLEDIFNNTTSNSTCNALFGLFGWNKTYNDFIFVFISFIFGIILKILRKKKKHGKCCCRFCCGIVVPVKFLDDKHNRAAIIAAFALISKQIFYLLFILDVDQLHKKYKSDPYQKVFIKLSIVQMMSFMYSPILAMCTNNSSIFVQFLGIIYALIELAGVIFVTFPWCEERQDAFGNQIESSITIIFFILTTVACFVLIARFIQKIVNISHRRVFQLNSALKYNDFHVQYVKNLLNSPPNYSVIDEDGELLIEEEEKISCTQRIYSNTKGFRYSTAILVSIYVGFFAVTVLASSYYGILYDNYVLFTDMVANLKTDNDTSIVDAVKIGLEAIGKFLFKADNDLLQKVLEKKMTTYELLRQEVNIIFGSIFVSITLAILILIVSGCDMLRNYKKNILTLSVKIKNKHLVDISKTSNVSIIVKATQFAGYQAAHIIWGFHIQVFVLTLTLLILSQLIILPLNFDFLNFLIIILKFIGPFAVVFLLTLIVQYVLVRLFFVQYGGKLLALDNRRAFYNMMYFMFFFNLLTGLFTCILRILKSLVFSILVLPRLDRSAFPHMFSRFDSGFKAYACLLKLEQIQSNSILIVFSRILKRVPQPELDYSSLAKNIIRPKKITCKRSFRARNRWFLAWTLLHNGPLLQGLRKIKRSYIKDHIA